MAVKVAIGLGNSGSRYEGTRHNAGMQALARIASLYGANFVRNKYCAAYLAKAAVAGSEVVFAAAEGYMNESGVNIANILRFLKADISEAVVFYDDITIALGKFKLSIGGSAGGHNGVANIMERCGNSFIRVRLGLGGKPFKEMDLADYVLGRFSEEERAAFEASLPAAKEAFEAVCAKGLAAAQNVYNRQ
ncbi:MAG: aminoacyl-tRNA hydrolase [Opitutales bacterium]|nr:aminoacyl-tRNA hydrolase [Opitutales bacterium]